MNKEKFELVERVLKEVYLDVIKSQIEDSDETLKHITFTTQYVYGKEIVNIEYGEKELGTVTKKDVEAITGEIHIPGKYFDINKTHLIIQMLNSKCEDMVYEIIKSIKSRIVIEYKKYNPSKRSANDIWKAVTKLPVEDLQAIRFHKMNDWLWNDVGGFFRQLGRYATYKAEIVCYGGITVPKKVLDKITDILAQSETEK